MKVGGGTSDLTGLGLISTMGSPLLRATGKKMSDERGTEGRGVSDGGERCGVDGRFACDPHSKRIEVVSHKKGKQNHRETGQKD